MAGAGLERLMQGDPLIEPPRSGELVSAERLREVAASILSLAGMRPGEAADMADVLVFAQESGIDSHGVTHLPAYVSGFASGSLNPRPIFRIEASLGAAVMLDADRAPGALAGFRACQLAAEKARQCGVAAVAVRNSSHFGAASAYAERLASAGMVSLILSNASPTVAPRGATTPLFGTNPIAAGFPRAQGAPVLIDFATTAGSRGKIRKAASEGVPIPADWALDRDGHPTSDAQAALSGTMQALGGEKGAILPLLVELFCVALSGGNPGVEALAPQEPSARPRGVSHLFIAMDARTFGGIDAVGERVAAICALVEGAAPVNRARPPRMPGSRGADMRTRSRGEGVLVTPALAAALEQAMSTARGIDTAATSTKVLQQ